MKAIAAALLAVLIFTACTNQGANEAKQTRQQGAGGGQIRQQQQDGQTREMRVAQQAADQIVKNNTVRQANVLVTEQNAYVAAVLADDKAQLTREIEEQIAQTVRSTDPTIQNVYVSTNPDFVQRINKYVNDIGEGRPVAGFVQQFNEMVQRIFPDAR